MASRFYFDEIDGSMYFIDDYNVLMTAPLSIDGVIDCEKSAVEARLVIGELKTKEITRLLFDK